MFWSYVSGGKRKHGHPLEERKPQNQLRRKGKSKRANRQKLCLRPKQPHLPTFGLIPNEFCSKRISDTISIYVIMKIDGSVNVENNRIITYHAYYVSKVKFCFEQIKQVLWPLNTIKTDLIFRIVCHAYSFSQSRLARTHLAKQGSIWSCLLQDVPCKDDICLDNI